MSDTTRDAAVSRAMRDAAAVSRATRRAVFERDGERCTFTNADGNRCPATTWLEIDHIVARACCGAGDLGNLRVRCRAHNRLHAEQTFGKEHVERKIHERRDPRRRGSPSESGAFGPACERERESPVSRMQLDGYTVAGNALVNMGFRRADVRRALGALSARHQADVSTPLSVQTILHEALALLT